ncbi:o-succinylbenzoate synthase [Glutamicibacter protophormiae]|uniref:o-succinylbenzoate synthase n=1 Tax=Glutamicibacter protophormiae TaxID=37930 RepID=A0ABS4XVT2_GLUPR|nr:o-succinylbenzoate synthase [Glutamicibacter protophormiae]MBP2400445.1 O-succinylbenzoate synthase [Glutamicibacter protophormiae]GGL93184.1 o-succinylbenzoate synthase [Glutamicibacter protophormiae]
MNFPLPALEEILAHSHVVQLPMQVKFRGVTRREALLIEGPAGWGEFSAFLEYGPQEASRWLAAAIEAAYQPFPQPLRTSIPVNATLPAVPANEVGRVLERYDAPHTIKIKVAEQGQSLDEDLARVAETRRLYPQAALRVDANTGWDIPTAVAALARLSDFDLQYAEQPVPGITGLAEVRAQLRSAGIPLKIAADEAVRKHTDPLEVSRLGAADLMVIKAQPLGGIQAVLDIAAQAELDVVVSSALDTSVGLAQAAALASALPELPYACGLSTGTLFADDVTDEPLLATAGYLPVRRVKPQAHKLAKLHPGQEREAWWHQRVRDCYAQLQAE